MTNMTNKLALIGYPLSHSLSSVIHNAALKDLGLEGTYEILETEPEKLIDRIKYLKTNNYTGFNVTIPHKVPITLFIDHVDALSDMAGSVNTVKIMPDKSFYGYNTDIYGFQRAMPDELQRQMQGKSAAIIGTGGASRACALVLANLGVSRIDFFTRNLINSSQTVNFLREKFPAITINLLQVQSMTDLSEYKMLVNATPIGMRGKAMDLCPVTENILKTLKPDATVYDIIYNPINTILIETAKKNGYATINGLEMFIYQAQKAFEIWTGKIPNINVMKIAVLEHLNK